MSMDTEQNLRTFISKWGTDFDTVIASFREHLADDVVWDQPGVAVTHTCQEAIDLLKGFKEQVDMATFEATIVQLAVNGNVAIAERIDHLRRSDRSLIASLSRHRCLRIQL